MFLVISKLNLEKECMKEIMVSIKIGRMWGQKEFFYVVSDWMDWRVILESCIVGLGLRKNVYILGFYSFIFGYVFQRNFYLVSKEICVKVDALERFLWLWEVWLLGIVNR